MAISARLDPKTELALSHYCKRHGISKTEALERAIAMLVNSEANAKHPAYIAYERLRDRLPLEMDAGEAASSAAQQRRMGLLDGIAGGEKAVDDGRILSHAQAKRRMARWLK